MENILTYIVLSRHDEYIENLIKNMCQNVAKEFQEFPSLLQSLQILCDSLKKPIFTYETKVLVFFFLITVDAKMRHWLLSTHQSGHDILQQRKAISRNPDMAPPNALFSLNHPNTPFLGQQAIFKPLNCYSAVSIFMAISEESFFDPICLSDDPEAMHDLYVRIKELVLLS